MKRWILLLLMMILLPLTPAQADSSEYDLTFTNRELSGAWDAAGAVTITGAGSTCDVSGKGASLSGSTLTIRDEGVYLLRGEFTGITVRVDADDKAKVQLVLEDAALTADQGPALLIENADKVFLTLPEGTESCLSSAAAQEQTGLDGAIFSRADLCINGKGSLTVTGGKHGIVSKDDLILVDARLTVDVAATALDGKDCVMLRGVTATLRAGTNGIRSDNAEDAGRGYIYLLDSALTIAAGNDGIQAETLLRADNTLMTITTGEGSASVTHASGEDWGWRGGFGGPGRDWGSSASTPDSTPSQKGLRAGQTLEISGGTLVIDAVDDALHCNGNLTITDGQFTLSSGDDGIHADGHLLISGGEIRIPTSYEGIEASKLEITGGRIDITANDDGLNAAGGKDDSAATDRWGRRDMFSSGVGEIIISGGYIHINASGDGIDSNNTVVLSGGVTLVSASAHSANAAFDYDGEATVTGGILIATGGSGMAQSFTSAENQGCMLFGLNGAGGRSLAIVDAQGQLVAAFTPDNDYSAVVVTAPGLQVGSTYTIVADAPLEGADAHGFASGIPCAGGTELGHIEMTTALQGGSGHGMGGGFGPGGGGRGPRGW